MEKSEPARKNKRWGRRKIIMVSTLLITSLLVIAIFLLKVYFDNKIRMIECRHCDEGTPAPTTPEKLAFYQRLQEGMDDALAKQLPSKILQITAMPTEQLSRERIEQVFNITLQPQPENSLGSFEYKTEDLQIWYEARRFRFHLDMLSANDVKQHSPGLALPFGNCMDTPDLLAQLNKQGWNRTTPHSARMHGGGEPYRYVLFKANRWIEIIYERQSNCVLRVGLMNEHDR